MNKKHFKTAFYCLSAKFGKRIPLKVTHFITDKCNLRCSYCYINYNKEKEMSTEQIKNMLNEFAKLGTQIYGIAGGEPLVREDIFEVIKYAFSEDIRKCTHLIKETSKEMNIWIEKLFS